MTSRAYRGSGWRGVVPLHNKITFAFATPSQTGSDRAFFVRVNPALNKFTTPLTTATKHDVE